MERASNKKIMRVVIIGLMAALVFVGNYFSFSIPNGVLVTRIHLGNSMCLLAGLLFSGGIGGLASGIGASMYDLFTPVYVLSAPYTFISKFAMGFVAGKLNRAGKDGKISIATTITAAVLGQLVYVVLYLINSFFKVLILGGTTEAAWIAVGTNSITSLINAGLSVVIAVPLYLALKKALSHTPVKDIINEKTEKKGYLNPVTVGLIIFAFVTATIYSINLASSSKIAAAEEKKEQALQDTLEQYEKRFEIIENELGIKFPVITTEKVE